jgi:hypothetical protein
MFVFRMEVIAQHGAADVRTPAIAAFLEDCRDPVVAVCRPSPTAGALAAGRASLLTAPCCWRSAEVRKQFGGARRSDRLLILVNERLDGFHVFAAFLVRLKFKPLVVFTPATMPETLEDDAGTPVEYLSAQTYLSLVAQGMEALPGLALDLSFGETGLQFLHEIFLRLGIPVVCGDDVIPQPSMTGGYQSGRVQSYEAMIAKVIAATRGLPVLDDRQRTALQDELDSDAGWAWLSQYSLLALG